MMELKYFALVLLVQTSFVISTPYGYGPRTGVSAKAEANAQAGAFGGAGSLPADIPTAAGYSGSFSKASSSSFASSSASSSASASSYSYGGSGVGGLPIGGEGNSGCGSDSCKFGVKGGNQGLSGSGSRAFSSNAASVAGLGGAGTGSTYNKGGSPSEPKTFDCGTGNCQLSGSKDSGSHGSTKSPNAYSSSNSLSATGSYNSQTPKCEGSDCDNASDANDKCASGQCAQDGNSEVGANPYVKCSSGNCGATPQSGGTSSYGSNNKCEPGQCGSNTQSGSASIDYNSNDIHVPTSSGISNANTNYGSNGPTPDKNANSGCKYGNCGASPASNLPSYTPEYPPCSSPNCNDYGLGPTSAPSNQGYSNKPATLLTTPKEDSECNTPNCQPASTPSKQGVNGYSLGYGAQSQKVFTNPSTSPCVGGNCNYGDTKAPYSTNLINSDSIPLSPSSPSNCASGNCNTYPSNQRPSGYGTSPGGKPYSHVSETQFSMQPYGPSCAPGSPNCGGITPSYVPSCAPGSPNCNTGSITPSLDQNCAPGSPSCGPGAVNPSFSSNPTKVTTSFGPICTPGTPGCTPDYVTPIGLSCAPGSPGCNAAAVTPFGPSCAPGSPGCKPGTVPSFGPSCAPGSPNCNAGTIVSGYAKPTQGLMPPFSPTGAENSFSGSTSLGSGHYSGGSYGRRPSGGSYGSRPSAGSYGSSPSHVSLPAQFPQSQNGNSYSVTGSSPYAPTGYQSGHTGSGTTPTIPSYNIPSSGFPSASGQNGIVTPAYTALTGGICNTPNCDGTGNIGVASGANAQSKPVGASSTSDELPTYSGGFGGPSGILNPNEFKATSAPYKPAISSHTPETGNPQGAPCANGNCGPHAHALPSYGNSGSYPGGQSVAGTGANVGFGGPAGILKPNEFTAPSSTYNKPATSSSTNPACSTGTCGLGVPSPSNVHGGSGSQATASASASANAVAYTGGFGGPPGFLKPYDGGKSEPSTGKSQSGHYGSHQGAAGIGAPSTYSNNGEIGSQLNGGIQGSSVAQAQAVASASSGVNAAGGYNHGGHKAGGSGECGAGCSAPSSGSYGDGTNFGTNGGLGPAKSGGLDGSKGGLNAAGANARSLAGAVGGSGAFGSSYASSSASAHATSGAAVKGSYGK